MSFYYANNITSLPILILDDKCLRIFAIITFTAALAITILHIQPKSSLSQNMLPTILFSIGTNLLKQ